MRDDCLTDDAVLDWVEGRLSAAERTAAEDHLETCSVCSEVVAAAAGGRAVLIAGATLGRYTIGAPLGAGGMGVVYAADDRELGRKVALKLVRHDRDSTVSSALLQREAQTLARLSHPNVVTVYDVAAIDDHVVIAMELVDGVTLRHWLSEQPRSYAAIGAVLRQAAAGLAAAHAIGIVHRDFKPENILVGRDGRVRVSDFGLSRLEAAIDEVAHVGEVIGTPAYMAPEQKAGEPVDARADVYAFCVVAWESWFGVRPSSDATAPRLALRREAGTKRALLAGLASSRSARTQTIAGVITALDSAEQRPRRAIAATALVAFVALGTVGVQQLRQRGCESEVAAWDGLWTPTQRAQVEAQAGKAGLPNLVDFVARVDGLIGRYVAAGRNSEREVCRAHGQAATSTALYDQQTLCLRSRRHEAATLIDALATNDPPVLGDAIKIASTLPHVESCTTAPSLVALAPLPNDPQKRAAIDALTATIAEAQAARTLARYPRCVEIAKPAVERARALDYAPLTAKALLVYARCREFTESIVDSEKTLHDAAAAAQRGGDLRTLGEAWSRLMFTTGYEHRDFVMSDHWSDYARAVLDRLHDDELEYKWALNAALAHSRAGRPDAEALFERSQQSAVRFAGPDSIEAITATTAIANHWLDHNEPERALELHRRGLEYERRRFGREYAGSIASLDNIALNFLMLGRNAEALQATEEALALTRANPGNGDDHIAQQTYAAALRANQKLDAALVADRAAAATCAKFLGEDWECAFALAGTGLDLLGQNKNHEAIEPLEHAWRLREKDELPDPEMALGLARALWNGGGDRKRATQLGERARVVQKQTLANAPSDTNRALLQTIEDWLQHHGA